MEDFGVLDGPWVEGFFFRIPVPVKSKSNFRRRSGSREWNAYKSFEDDVKVLATRALPSSWELGSLELPLSSRPVVVNFIFALSRLDTANLSKSLLDGCEGVVFHTDASIRGVAAISERTSSVGSLAAFARLDPKVSNAEILAALSALSAEGLKLVAR